MSLHILNHPLSSVYLSGLRDISTAAAEFRRSLSVLADMLLLEATRALQTEEKEVVTPLCLTTGQRLAETVGLVPILRAGLGMVESALTLLPEAQVWHLGLYRDEETASPVHYYSKLPEGQPVDVAFVLDPMLATGGSALAAIEALKDWGVRRISLLSIIAATPGIDRVRTAFPDVDVYAAAVDLELNDRKFIVPGLGDAGDRLFHTA